ncbi:hypothetical protein Pcinc_038203 [Petrolisthes cinctipes]|uniref:Uncharacterized protein n=1 Tax=Petrolisthes cinctipes TaxID=88211 RepID=A0AAE1BS31_PETCI|nr:hypothetical protein Pcinc_038203 [Petrolisthes cinctipes]
MTLGQLKILALMTRSTALESGRMAGGVRSGGAGVGGGDQQPAAPPTRPRPPVLLLGRHALVQATPFDFVRWREEVGTT